MIGLNTSGKWLMLLGLLNLISTECLTSNNQEKGKNLIINNPRYLKEPQNSLTQIVKSWKEYTPDYFP